MTDFTQRTAFLIPCPPQVADAITAFTSNFNLDDWVGDTSFLGRIQADAAQRRPLANPMHEVLLRAIERHPDLADGIEPSDLRWGITFFSHPEGVAVKDYGALSSSVAVAALIQAILQVFEIGSVVVMRVSELPASSLNVKSLSADINVHSGYGGEAYVVSADRIEAIHDQTAVRATYAALSRGEHHHVAEITYSNANGHCTTSRFLMACERGQRAEDRLLDLAMEWLGDDGVLDETSGKIRFDDNDETIESYTSKPVSPAEAAVLRQYLVSH